MELGSLGEGEGRGDGQGTSTKSKRGLSNLFALPAGARTGEARSGVSDLGGNLLTQEGEEHLAGHSTLVTAAPSHCVGKVACVSRPGIAADPETGRAGQAGYQRVRGNLLRLAQDLDPFSRLPLAIAFHSALTSCLGQISAW